MASTKSTVDSLRNISLFSECSAKELGLVVKNSTERVLKAGTIIMDQGQTGREAYVILEGSATIKRNGKKIASLLKCGMVSINSAFSFAAIGSVPFGGVKDSGYGRIHGADYSLLDYNRAGIPLVEIVTKIVNGCGKYAPEVAKAYVSELRDVLRGLGVSDVKMEQGSLRCDANVSLRLIGSDVLGTRSETKNVNSLRSVERAIRGEMIRHAERLNNGERVVQETRHFQEDTGLTRSGRSKEQAEDYRYFPEPDLVPVAPDAAWIEQLRAALPERPSIHRKRLQEQWAVPDKEMSAMINADVLDVVEATVALGADPTKARGWWLGEISRIANEKDVAIKDLPIAASDVAEIVALVNTGDLTDKLARQVVEGVIAGEGKPAAVIAARGIKVVNDDSALMAAIERACAGQPETAQKVRDGHLPAAGALIGMVMKDTKGQADAAKVRSLLLAHLGQSEG